MALYCLVTRRGWLLFTGDAAAKNSISQRRHHWESRQRAAGAATFHTICFGSDKLSIQSSLDASKTPAACHTWPN
jgi:hypothetical protein